MTLQEILSESKLFVQGRHPLQITEPACLGKSDRDFLNKLKIVEEELDETLYWLELTVESGLVKPNLLDELMKENEELFKIIVSSITTVKKNIKSKNDSSKNK